MKDKRYKASGATQIMGIGAMFSVRKLVSATIKMEGQAASSTQFISCDGFGGKESFFSTSSRAVLLRLRHAKTPQNSTKTP